MRGEPPPCPYPEAPGEIVRIALYFDGKNHMKALRRAANSRWLDHGALAQFIVKEVGGTSMYGAFYYTGVPVPHETDGPERRALSDLLDELERRPGFFVRRYNRRAASRDCPHCQQTMHYTEEKLVDTSLVADMVMHAVADAYDIAVVFSGDLDIAPGIDAVHALGKRAWVATFGSTGLSRSLLRSAWGHVDLLRHLDEYTFRDLGELAAEEATDIEAPPAESMVDREILRELRRAQTHFAAGGGFVGAHYFVHRWKGHDIPDGPELRRAALQRLIEAGKVETYAVDGKTALRAPEDD